MRTNLSELFSTNKYNLFGFNFFLYMADSKAKCSTWEGARKSPSQSKFDTSTCLLQLFQKEVANNRLDDVLIEACRVGPGNALRHVPVFDTLGSNFEKIGASAQ
ncbi:MAG: hypothetical protein ACI9LD_000162 [Polaromonas sp.]|jgi:hypothetical protein